MRKTILFFSVHDGQTRLPAKQNRKHFEKFKWIFQEKKFDNHINNQLRMQKQNKKKLPNSLGGLISGKIFKKNFN